MQKEELIKTLTQKKDPRSVKWENKVILDTLQELQSSQVSDIVKAVNDKFECASHHYSPTTSSTPIYTGFWLMASWMSTP